MPFRSSLIAMGIALILSACGAPNSVRQLAACPTAFFTPVGWSVDGKMVYYELDYHPHADIRTVNLDGTGDHVIIADAFSARLSPDRTKILATPMSHLTPNANKNTYLLDSVNGATWDRRSITIPGMMMSWSPDSQWIVSDGGSNSGPLVKINVATGEIIQITEKSGSQRGGDGSPLWSPDGQTIAFSRYDGRRPAVYLVSPDGGQLTRLTDARAPAECQPPQYDEGDTPFRWMPDGKTLGIYHGCGEIQYVTRDGRMTDHWGQFSPQAVNFQGSPDGKHVLFGMLDPDTSHNVFIANVDGSEVKLLSTDMLWPIWSPDGRKILFTHYGASEIFAMNADGSGMKQLAQNPGAGRVCLH